MKNKINKDVTIHCYKHNGMLNKVWEEAVILDEKEDYIVVGNDNVLVLRRDGRAWRTKEKAIVYFFKNHWYNVVVQFKRDGIYYYCNMASPYIIDMNIIKYIDYDLDLRVYPKGKQKILDKNEYEYHKNIMKYSKDLDIIIQSELKTLLNLKENQLMPFNKEENMKYYNLYCSMNK
ncbi:MAG: DUF402 domain-containing protein [Bacilli bacterium]